MFPRGYADLFCSENPLIAQAAAKLAELMSDIRVLEKMGVRAAPNVNEE